MMKSVGEEPLGGKRVLVRCDFNVPLDDQGNMLDDSRILSAQKTIGFLISKGAKVILLSHLGEPEGRVVERLRLDAIRSRLSSALAVPVAKTEDCMGAVAESAVAAMKDGDVLLLENLRFHPEEEANSPEFARQLARLGDCTVNEAFSASHREHASIAQLPKLLPAFAGFELLEEVRALELLLQHPKKPMVVVVGGTKVETKVAFLDTISNIADVILVSNLIAKEIASKDIRFPNMAKLSFPVDGNPGNGVDLDIGPRTIELFCEVLKTANTVFWSGPMGKIEDVKYTKGTSELARAIVSSGAYSVAGGGDLSGFLRKNGLDKQFSYISTGGGALLAFLAGDKLPGLEVLGYYNGN
jgi:phosphoglycerate kinase